MAMAMPFPLPMQKSDKHARLGTDTPATPGQTCGRRHVARRGVQPVAAHFRPTDLAAIANARSQPIQPSQVIALKGRRAPAQQSEPFGAAALGEAAS